MLRKKATAAASTKLRDSRIAVDRCTQPSDEPFAEEESTRSDPQLRDFPKRTRVSKSVEHILGTSGRRRPFSNLSPAS